MPNRPRHWIHLLPELRTPRVQGLTVLVLPDGNRRATTGELGYGPGASKVVEIAEHVARRGDVRALVVCVASPENIARRSDDFFLDLQQAFRHLDDAIATKGALVDAGIRLGVVGSLATLHARGGHGAELAAAIEAAIARTDAVRSPRLHLILAVGYSPDTLRELDVDLVIRTGMEDRQSARLSGLHPDPSVRICGLTTLWPAVGPSDIDGAIDSAKAWTAPVFGKGMPLATVVELARAIDGAALVAPVRLTIGTHEPPAQIARVLDREWPCSAGQGRRVALLYPDEQGEQRRLGDDAAEHTIAIASTARPLAIDEVSGASSWLAPGQSGLLFTLPAWPPLEHATVHACASTVAGIVEGVREALRFAGEHPPLLGGDRTRARPERDARAERFADRWLAWLDSMGLMPPTEPARRAFRNYALTGFFIEYGISPALHPGDWEPRAAWITRYMLLVAGGDEGIFDRALPDASDEQRRLWLAASARYLDETIRAGAVPPSLPDVPGRELLASIAAGWVNLIAEHAGRAAPLALERWRAGLSALYGGSIADYDPAVTDNPLIARLGAGGDAHAASAIEQRYCAAAPAGVAARLRALLATVADRAASSPDALAELRVLLYLLDAGDSVGASMVFRTAALGEPAATTTPERLAALDAVAMLLDGFFRLRNDLSGFLASGGGDRDGKENAGSILVPRGIEGAAREAAVKQAFATCRRIAGWMQEELGREVAVVTSLWPYMGAVIRRGMFIGRRVYETGHYSEVTPAQIRAIADELEQLEEARA